MMDDLLRLSAVDLDAFAAALRTGRVGPPYTPVSLQRVLTGKAAQAIAPSMQGLSETGFTPEQIAITLELIARDRHSRPRLVDEVELVTTGPETVGNMTRDTSVVVRELFANSRKTVLVAGYAVYQGQRLFQTLADRMRNDPLLHVRLYLDIQRGFSDSSLDSEIIRRFEERFRTREWPSECRLPEVYYDPRSMESQGQRACLHAKCVVIDDEQLFVSSANFTEAAHERNVEVGLLVRSHDVASRVTRFFNNLAEAGTLRRAF